MLAVTAAALMSVGMPAHAFRLWPGSYCPVNHERPYRQATSYIILHTTEGPRDGSLSKLWANGEANYMVDRAGKTSKIVDHRRAACHCGRSMWDGRENIDRYSVGIEVVGFHDGDITTAQAATLKSLIGELQRIYGIPDGRVLTHSMVAYAEPNQWFRRPHRGRKRCGMLFARQSVRARLGLYDQPRSDPDVRAGRLMVGDPYLANVLYGPLVAQAGAGAAAAMHSRPRAAGPPARPAGGSAPPQGNAAATPARAGTGVKEIGTHGRTAWEIAGKACDDRTTIYFLRDGRVRRGDELGAAALGALPAKTRMLVGYVYGGYVTSTRSVSEICGPRWRAASTLYRFPDGSIRQGNAVSEAGIPLRTMVFWPA